MATSAQQIRAYQGPALFSYGFRPMFLLAGAWPVFAMLLWAMAFGHGMELPMAFTMMDWHVHELLFGYVPAVVAGFLLTAVPNWTGRLPVVGSPLIGLVVLWLAGRIAILLSASIGAMAAAIMDVAFLVVLAAVVAREIMAAGNTRNLKVLVLLILLAVANGLFHWQAQEGSAATGSGARLGIAAVLLLIMLIGGRIVPSFTHTWLARRGPGRLPVSFNRLDMVIVALSAATLGVWVVVAEHPHLAPTFALAGLANLWRMIRWAGGRTAAEPLVLVLHVAFAFVPLGFLLGAAVMLWPSLAMPGAYVHAWTAGAIGLMTLAVMTRASLGHTGQALHATPAIAAIYVLVALSAVLRIAGGFASVPDWVTHGAALLWMAGYALFTLRYAPLLLKRRPA